MHFRQNVSFNECSDVLKDVLSDFQFLMGLLILDVYFGSLILTCNFALGGSTAKILYVFLLEKQVFKKPRLEKPLSSGAFF